MKVMILEANAQLLEQAADVLAGIRDAVYTRAALIFDGQRIGGHIRHVIEFYEGLLSGFESGRVDYDLRRRDPVLETERKEAVRRLRALAALLREDMRLRSNCAILIAGEGAGYAESTLDRELQALASHTVHHFALIAVLLRYQGLTVPADFGVSKATLDFRARQREAA